MIVRLFEEAELADTLPPFSVIQVENLSVQAKT